MNMKEIAQKAGVSAATVSNVLNDTGSVSTAKKEEILKIVRDEGYVPNRIAKSLRTKKSNTIGILVEDITAFQTPRIINGINGYAEKNGYTVLLNDMGLLKKVGKDFDAISQYQDVINKGIQLFERAQVDGIIYVALHDRDVSNLVRPLRIPLVFAYCYDISKKSCYITYDNKDISKKITQYLIDHNHKDIGIICGPETSKPAHMRYDAYAECLLENHLKVKNEYIYPGDWEFESGRLAYERFKNNMCKPTAVFAMNDLMAVGFMDAAFDDGLRIPEDVSVIGFDNQQFSEFTRPRLTTVELPLEEMGEEAGKRIIDLIANKKVKEKEVVIACKFVEGSSATNKV